MSIDLSQFHGMFFQECSEAVSIIESGCLAIDIESADQEAINRMFRAAHSIKGGSATFGFSQVAEFTHSIENLLDELRSGQRVLGQQVVDALLSSVDGLRAMLAAAQQGSTIAAAEIKRYQQALAALAPNSSPPEPDFVADQSVVSSPSSPRLQTAEIDTRARAKDQPGEPLAPVYEGAVRPAKVSGGLEGKSLRVDLEKVDELVNMVGEIVITQSMLNLLSEDEVLRHHQPLRQGLLQLQQQTQLMQEGVLQIRMLPLAYCFNRYPRMVRDISAKLGKQIELKVSGEQTEVDRIIIENLTDPLLHLLRNSIDHGIETPARRREKGKTEGGRITINAFNRAGNVVIQVEDDGKGLDVQLLISKAKEKQLIATQTALTDAQAFELIFLPGFSTLDAANDVSGRGVGMDVVRRNIQALGGTIQVTSVLDKGTCFTLKLPLTLAIMQGQLVRVGHERYVLPLVKIIESLQPDAAADSQLAESHEAIFFRGQTLPVVRLAALLETPQADPERRLAEGIIVIVESDCGPFGLFVDDLLAQQQIVIKPLDEHYQSIRSIFGATILGDGQVALIIDVDELGQALSKPFKPAASTG